MKHFLFESALNFKKNSENQNIKGFNYDNIRGAWISDDGKLYLIKAKFKGKPIFGTKKNDVETGEDLKSQ